MGINSEERERLEKLSNLELVEHFMTMQQQCIDLFNKREMNRNNMEKWETYHDQYYQKTSELIEIKYMIVSRMNKGDLYDQLKHDMFDGALDGLR